MLDELRERLVPFGPRVEEAEVRDAETAIGLSFPRLMREVWTEIGAGRLTGHPHTILRPSEVARRYQSDRSDDRPGPWRWPFGLACIADLGCGITACLDLSTPEAPVWWFDPNLDGPVFDSYAPPWQSPLTLHDWLSEFAAGSSFKSHWHDVV